MTVPYGGYVGTGTNGIGYNSGLCVVANLGANHRIKVDGPITHVRIQLASAYIAYPLGGPVVFRLHRDVGASLDGSHVLAASSQIAAGGDIADNTIYALDSAVEAAAGDVYSIEWTGEVNHRLGFDTSVTGAYMGYQNAAKADLAAWGTVGTGYAAAIEVFGTAPSLILAGDSISVGHGPTATTGAWASNGDNVGFYAATYRNPLCNTAALIRNLTGGNFAVGSNPIVSSYNAGYGGSKASEWAASYWASRITPYATAGATVLIHLGANDLLLNSYSLATYLGHFDTLLAKAVADGVTLVVSPTLYVPAATSYNDSGGTPQGAAYWNAIIDTWNAGLIAWAKTNSVKVVDARSVVGTNTVSTSNIHPDQAGYGLLALAWAAGLQQPSVVFPAAAEVVDGTATGVVGVDGTYPTTATSKAEQYAEDRAAVTAASDHIDGGTTIIGIEGTGMNSETVQAAVRTAVGLAEGETVAVAGDEMALTAAERVELRKANLLTGAMAAGVLVNAPTGATASYTVIATTVGSAPEVNVTQYRYAAFASTAITAATSQAGDSHAFLVYAPGQPSTVLWSLTTAAGEISVGGTDNKTVTLVDTDAHMGTAGRFPYMLRNTTDDTVVCVGYLTIVDGPNVPST